jgi:hypothetical protein
MKYLPTEVIIMNNELTFAFDVEFDDQSYIPKGTKVQRVYDRKECDGAKAVLIKKVYTNDNKPMLVNKVEYFMDCSFVEFRK